MKLVENYLSLIQEDDLNEFVVAGIMAAIMAYKRYLSNAAKKCKGSSGRKRTICIISNQLIALNKSISDFQKALNTCQDDKCKNKIKDKIMKLNKKIEELQTKLKKAKEGLKKDILNRELIMV